MNLDEFVAETIKDVMAGATRAGKAVSGYGACVGPKVAPGEPDRIAFDVAVTVQHDDSKKARAGILVYCLKLGGSTSSGSAHEVVSRIQFSIPVRFPSFER